MRLLNLLAILLVTSNAWAKNKIILNTHEQPPLSFLDESMSPDGTAIKPLIYSLRKMGWDYEIRFFPWARAQWLIKNNDGDGFFAASQNPERDNEAVRSAAITSQTRNWYLLKKNMLDPNAPDFKHKATVGSYLGANMLKWLKSQNYHVTGEPPHPDQLFLMLKNGRFDACLANDYNYNNFIKKNPDMEGVFRSVLQQSEPLFIYFSKKFIEKNPDFLTTFNRHLADYHANDKRPGLQGQQPPQ
jgi:polar amino acid transport system substrate-binding protein